MSKRVNLSRPLSEEDKEYLRGVGRYAEVALNERRFPSPGQQQPAPTPEPESTAPAQARQPQLDPEDLEWVNSLKVEELKDELSNRDMSIDGTMQQLRDRLMQALLGADA